MTVRIVSLNPETIIERLEQEKAFRQWGSKTRIFLFSGEQLCKLGVKGYLDWIGQLTDRLNSLLERFKGHDGGLARIHWVSPYTALGDPGLCQELGKYDLVVSSIKRKALRGQDILSFHEALPAALTRLYGELATGGPVGCGMVFPANRGFGLSESVRFHRLAATRSFPEVNLASGDLLMLEVALTHELVEGGGGNFKDGVSTPTEISIKGGHLVGYGHLINEPLWEVLSVWAERVRTVPTLSPLADAVSPAQGASRKTVIVLGESSARTLAKVKDNSASSQLELKFFSFASVMELNQGILDSDGWHLEVGGARPGFFLVCSANDFLYRQNPTGTPEDKIVENRGGIFHVKRGVDIAQEKDIGSVLDNYINTAIFASGLAKGLVYVVGLFPRHLRFCCDSKFCCDPFKPERFNLLLDAANIYMMGKLKGTKIPFIHPSMVFGDAELFNPCHLAADGVHLTGPIIAQVRSMLCSSILKTYSREFVNEQDSINEAVDFPTFLKSYVAPPRSIPESYICTAGNPVSRPNPAGRGRQNRGRQRSERGGKTYNRGRRGYGPY